MNTSLIVLSLVWLLAMACLAACADTHGEPVARKEPLATRRHGTITLYHSPESEPIADRVARYADLCNHRLAEWFGDGEPARQNVYWLSSRDWINPPETYGFPYNLGPNAILAAADVDLPDQLALIADFMKLEQGGEPVRRMAKLLGLEDAGAAEVHRALTKSKRFFVDYTLGFILPHEMMHGYCSLRGYPESPRWYHEGIAQWSALQMQAALRSPEEAEMIDTYYGLLWDRVGDALEVGDFAEADRLGHTRLDTPNYAWYHAGLLRMFRELEERRGAPLLPALIAAVGREHRGCREVAPSRMIATFSAVVGEDLADYFKQRWNLG